LKGIFEIGRLEFRILVAISIILVAASLTLDLLELAATVNIKNPYNIVSSGILLFLLYWLMQGADWARFILGICSPISFIILVPLLFFYDFGFNYSTLYLSVCTLTFGWFVYVLFLSNNFKAELAARRKQRRSEEAKELARLEADEIRRGGKLGGTMLVASLVTLYLAVGAFASVAGPAGADIRDEYHGVLGAPGVSRTKATAYPPVETASEASGHVAAERNGARYSRRDRGAFEIK
jgi:hypothetical protein